MRISITPSLLRIVLFAYATVLMAALYFAGQAAAQTYLPSIKIGTAALISPTAANTYYHTDCGSCTTSTDGLAESNLNGPETPTPTPTEIVELARALKNDPDLIYQYVENNIQIVWMYGLQKGALGAEIDKSGTAFDQAELMVALLRQAGYTTSYVAGTIVLNQAQFQAWSGITNARAACQLLSGGSIPAVINGTTNTNCVSGFAIDATVSSVQMAHIWVKVTITGSSCTTNCIFDPAYKGHTWKTGIDLASATGFRSGDAYNAAIGGYNHGTDASGAPWASTFKTTATGGLNGVLQGYSSSLLTAIQTQHLQGAQMEDVIGGKVIVPVTTSVRQTALAYADPSPPYTPITWTPSSTDAARYNAIPDKYRTTFQVIGLTYQWPDDQPAYVWTQMFNPTFYVDEIYGRRLSVITDFTFDGINLAPNPELALQTNTIGLRLDGKQFIHLDDFKNHVTAEVPNTTRDLPARIQLVVSHPYAASADGTPSTNGDYMDASVDKNVMLTTSLSIVHGWGDVSPELLTKWSGERGANSLLPKPIGCYGEQCTFLRTGSTGDFDREKTTAAWLAQYTRAASINAALAHSTAQLHHVIGVVYADNDLAEVCRFNWAEACDLNVGASFDRIDVDSALSLTNRVGGSTAATDRRGALHAIAAASAALEGSVGAQMFDIVDPASTATRFEWANSPPVDPLQNPGTLGPQKFYEFNLSDASALSGLVQDEGYRMSSCPHGSSSTPWMQQPPLGADCGQTGVALASEVQSYAAANFDVVTSQEAFLGPGQRAGTIHRDMTFANYTHLPSKQRGGAFVASKYDSNGDPTEIAHIQVAERTNYALQVVTKGGGGGAQPDMNSTYNPATAGDIVKSQFVDRSNALGVNLKDGSLGYTSPASLHVGNGGFPNELSASMSWHPGPHSGIPTSPTEPHSNWVMNWLNTIGPSGSALEAMGQSDIRPAAGTIVAFLAAQDVYKTNTPSPAREAVGVLANAWWADSISGNTLSVNVGGDAKQFVRLPDGTTIMPGTGYGNVAQTGTRVAFDYMCSVLEAPYAYSRGWNSSGVSFDVTNANGDVQHFANWTNSYDMQVGSGDGCGRKTGYRLTTWTFPFGVQVTLDYGNPDLQNLDRLIDVKNNIGRQIDFVYQYDPLVGFTNHLTGTDLRQVTFDANFTTTTDPAGAVTNFTLAAWSPQRAPAWWPFLATVATASNPAQTNVEYDYDNLGRVMQVKDATALNIGGRNPYIFYLADGTRGERDDPLGQAYSVFYDTYGHPSRYFDEMAHETDALFDSRGRSVSYTYPEGDCEVFAYDDHNNTIDHWKVDTASSCNTAAGSTHVLHESVAWDQTWNKPHLVTNARGFITELDYYTSGTGQVSLLQQAIRPTITEGTPTYAFDYDALGRLADATDPTGIVTHNTYSGTAPYNLTSTKLDYSTGSGHLNLTTLFGYDAQGDVISTTDPRAFVTTSLYDNDRRKTEDDHHDGNATAALNAASQTVYDNLGRVTDDKAGTAFSGTAVTAWLTTKHATYTPTSLVDTATDADSRVTDSTYDDGDRLITVADPLSRKTHFVYCQPGDTDCAANQVKKEIRAWVANPNCTNGTSLQQCYRQPTYFADGELKSVKDANGNITTYAYDGWRRLTQTIFPDSTILHPDLEQLSLDQNGNVTQRTNRAGQILTYQYNALDWITQKTSPSPAAATNWTYLLDGKIDVLSDTTSSSNNIDYGYDTAGRMNQVKTKLSGLSGMKSTNYVLDANGNRTKLTWPGSSGYYVGYCYDSLNRMTQAMENSTSTGCATNLLATYQYDPLSRRTNLTYAGTGAQVQTPSATAYSAAGDLLNMAHVFPGGTSNNNTFAYTYTNAHQTNSMTASNAAWFWQPPANNSTSYAPNNLNQYASVAGVTQSYDGNGNLTGDGTWTFGYDAENRLLTANKTAGGTIAATYAYDPLGRRVHKSGTGVTETYFLGDGTDEIAEYDNTNTVTVRYVPGPAIDEPIAMENASTGAKEFFHTDKQGSVVAMSNTTGALVEGPYAYDPYGNCFAGASPCSSSGEPYRFTGQRFDAETGCYYYRARYYCADDKRGGRFLQTDPVGYSADLNLYTYVGNDPTDETDPTGLKPTAGCGSRLPGENSNTCEGEAAASSGQSGANGSAGSERGNNNASANSQQTSSATGGNEPRHSAYTGSPDLPLGGGGEDIIFGIMTIPIGGEGFVETVVETGTKTVIKEGAEQVTEKSIQAAGKSVKEILGHDPLKGTKPGTLDVRQAERDEYAKLTQHRVERPGAEPRAKPRTTTQRIVNVIRMILKLIEPPH